MSISETRRRNFQLLAEQHGGQAGLATSSKKAPAYISQLMTGVRNLGEASSRGFEKTLGLPHGWLDSPRLANEPLTPFPNETWEQLGPQARALVLTVVDFFRLNGGATQAEEATLLNSFRSCSPEARAILLAVAKSQAASSKSRVRKPKVRS